jgi:hypothetical protein
MVSPAVAQPSAQVAIRPAQAQASSSRGVLAADQDVRTFVADPANGHEHVGVPAAATVRAAE